VHPEAFCHRTRDELAIEQSDEGCERGARAVCSSMRTSTPAVSKQSW
jgi:hypothetical protein